MALALLTALLVALALAPLLHSVYFTSTSYLLFPPLRIRSLISVVVAIFLCVCLPPPAHPPTPSPAPSISLINCLCFRIFLSYVCRVVSLSLSFYIFFLSLALSLVSFWLLLLSLFMFLPFVTRNSFLFSLPNTNKTLHTNKNCEIFS